MNEKLAALRERIDTLDDRLLDLLRERMERVAAIAVAKQRDAGGGIALRPAREAMILRRLLARAQDALPAATVLRIWRELFAAAIQLQSPLRVAVCGETCALATVARDHFGVVTPLLQVQRPAQALRLVSEGEAQLALLPLPSDRDDWWLHLGNPEPPPLRVVSRLPFLHLERPHPSLSGYLLGDLPLEESGDDLSLLLLETAEDTSRSRLTELLERAGLAPRWIASRSERGRALGLHLVEVHGFHDGYSPALQAAFAPLRSRLLRLRCLGAYPRPLDVAAAGACS